MLWNTLILALREMRRNLLRSGLTILGIVIGVCAVITMVTLGDGATERVKGDIAKLGFNLIILAPGVERKGSGGLIPGADPFEMADVESIRDQVAFVDAVAPLSVHPMLAIAGNRNVQTVAQGSDNAFFRTRRFEVELGREFTQPELRGGKPVCILGETVRNELFGRSNPVGEKIRLGRLSYEIVGVLETKGQSINGDDQDDFVVMPLRTLQRRITGNRKVSMIFVSAESEQAAARVKEGVERLMRERRRIPSARFLCHVECLEQRGPVPGRAADYPFGKFDDAIQVTDVILVIASVKRLACERFKVSPIESQQLGNDGQGNAARCRYHAYARDRAASRRPA